MMKRTQMQHNFQQKLQLCGWNVCYEQTRKNSHLLRSRSLNFKKIKILKGKKRFLE